MKPATATRARERLGETLVRTGRLTRAELARALDAQQVNGRRLGTNLLMLGCLHEEELARILSQQLDVEAIDRIGPVSEEVRALVPEGLAQLHQVFPLAREEGRLRLAMADPGDAAAIREVARAAGCPVTPVVAPELVISHAIFRQYETGQPPETLDLDANDITLAVGLHDDDSLSMDLTV